MLSSEPRHGLFRAAGLPLLADAVFIGNARGAAAFTHYTGDDIEAHICGEKGWGTPQVLRASFAYIFGTADCIRCTARVRADRQEAAEIAIRLGFRLEGVLRQADNGLDVLLFGMLREECRWVPNPQR